jgi:acyl-coenzyme A thioesterase PaaI-like protein
MKPAVFRLILNLWPPFLFAGIRVTEVAAGYRRARVELRMRPWNRNYVGTHFGGSLFSMTDPFWMLLVLQSLGRDYIVWDKAGEIEFVKPGRGTVRACFELDSAVLAELREAAADGAKVLRWFDTDVVDADGYVVARVRKQLYVRRKRGR